MCYYPLSWRDGFLKPNLSTCCWMSVQSPFMTSLFILTYVLIADALGAMPPR
ncbi:hypothetical protein AHAS_Ahas10G0108800 [Arachis hypogaea]